MLKNKEKENYLLKEREDNLLLKLIKHGKKFSLLNPGKKLGQESDISILIIQPLI